MAKRDFFWAFLLFAIYLLFWLPTLNVQPRFSTGDFGRDLYAFQTTLQGYLPCRDYWWSYGPLAPFYYAFWFLIGGVNVVSARMGLCAIYILSAFIAYAALRLFTSRPVAFLSSLAFLNMDMTWTFNHVGAIPFLLMAIFSLWKFFLKGRLRWYYLGLLSLALVALVKINIGLTSSAAFFTALVAHELFLRQGKSRALLAKKHFFLSLLLFFLGLFGAYQLLYWGIPADWVEQCMGLKTKYTGILDSPWLNVKHLILRFLVWEKSRLFRLLALAVFGAFAFVGLRKKEFSTEKKKVAVAVIGSLLLVGLANSMEYVAAEGMIYRFDFWIFPVFVLLMGLLAGWGSVLFNGTLKVFLGCLIFLLLLLNPFQNFRDAFAWKVPERFLDFPRGKVYVGKLPVSDIEIIRKVTRYIIENTNPTQQILTIPYDSLYCFLSDRRHAVPELMFMESRQISEKQEERIIGEIEAKRVPLVLITNRYRSSELGVGHFGVTHCKKLSEYIFSRYEKVQRLGPWEADSGHHAVEIWKRKGG